MPFANGLRINVEACTPASAVHRPEMSPASLASFGSSPSLSSDDGSPSCSDQEQLEKLNLWKEIDEKLPRKRGEHDLVGATFKMDESAHVMMRQVTPMTPEKTPMTSKSHIELWDTANETVILFDWDDTLCPTTHLSDDIRQKWNEVGPCFTKEQDDTSCEDETPTQCLLMGELEQHENTVMALLRLAVTMGQVVIVTLAEVGWVEVSCRHFMPRVKALLKELEIEVVYARKAIPTRYLMRATEEDNDLKKVLKTRAMSQVLKKFYGKGQDGRSWKNIISIGDSTAERLALQDVVFRREQRDSNGRPKQCRCKVVKLLDEPSVDRLTAELQVLVSWLVTIVCQDDDVDIDFSEVVGDEEPISPPISPSD